MPIAPVQVNAGGANTIVPANSDQTVSVSATFNVDVTVHDSIFVFLCVDVGTGGGLGSHTFGTPTITDNQLNAYSLIFWRNGAAEQGPSIGCWVASDVVAGHTAVTAQFSAHSDGIISPLDDASFNNQMGIAEYPFLCTIQGFDRQFIFGTNTGAALAITDSIPEAVTATLPEVVTGVNWAFALVDLLTSGGINYLIVCGMSAPSGASDNTIPPVVTPSKYGLMVRELDVTVPILTPANDTVIYLWDKAQFPGSSLSLACPSSVASLGFAYDSFFVASGGTTPYVNYAIISGSLPTGLSLNTSTGEVTGTPSVAGSFSYTGQVTDSAAATAQRSCTIVVSASHLTLVKRVNGNAPATDWTLAAAGPTSLSGAGGVSRTAVAPGVYTLSESGSVPGYSASAWSISGTGGSLVGNVLTIAPGDDVIATISNTNCSGIRSLL